MFVFVCGGFTTLVSNGKTLKKATEAQNLCKTMSEREQKEREMTVRASPEDFPKAAVKEQRWVDASRSDTKVTLMSRNGK